jgi:hypothetical protein
LSLTHSYLEMARASITSLGHSELTTDEFIQAHGADPLANAILSVASVTVIYSFLAIESFVNYQLCRLWERRHDGSSESSKFIELLGDHSRFEDLKNNKKVRTLRSRIKTLCEILGYKKPHEVEPHLWEDFNQLLEVSRHFFIHPLPEEEYFQKNVMRIGLQTQLGKYVNIAKSMIAFLYQQSRKKPPDWLEKNTLIRIPTIELIAAEGAKS